MWTAGKPGTHDHLSQKQRGKTTEKSMRHPGAEFQRDLFNEQQYHEILEVMNGKVHIKSNKYTAKIPATKALTIKIK